MTVGNPNILYFLIAIAVVVLIHLLNLQRFKKVYFSNIRLLNTVIEEKRKRSKLENIFLIILRSLIVGCLVFGFSKFIFQPNTQIGNQQDVAIYVDNSLSNSRKIGEPNLLDLQKKYARELVESLGDDFRYHIISNDFYSGKHAKFIDKNAALQKLDNLQLSHFTKSSGFILNKTAQSRKNYSENRGNIQFYLSDFQKNQHLLESFSKYTTQTYLIPLQSLQNENISIEQVATTSPILIKNEPINLVVSLKNHNDKAFKSLPLKIYSGNTLKTVQQINLEPLEELNVNVELRLKPEESNQLKIEIEDHSFAYDNVFYTALKAKKQLKVAHIYGKSPNVAFNNLYNTSLFNYKAIQENNIDYSTLNSYDYFILDELSQWNSGLAIQLKDILGTGKNALVVPSQHLEKLNAFLSQLGPQHIGYKKQTQKTHRYTLNKLHPIFKRMFGKKQEDELSQINQIEFLKPLHPNPEEKSIILSNNQVPFLSSLPINKGAIYLLYSNLSTNTNFSQHQMFAPLGINMAFINGKKSNNHITLGLLERIDVPTTIKAENIKIQFGEKRISANVNRFKQNKYISIDEQFTDIGFFDILNKDETIATYGVNENRKESDMQFHTADRLKKLGETASHLHILDTKKKNWNTFINNQKHKQNDWLYFLYAALFLYIIEMVFVLFLNKNSTHETAH